MSANKDSSRPRPEGQPQSAIDDYARRVAGDLAKVVIPQAIQLLTMPTDSPAAAYRLRLGALIAPLLRLWAALDGRTDRFELHRLLMAADDFEPELNALLTGPAAVNDAFIALTGQDTTAPGLAYIITTTDDLNTLEEMQQEVAALAQSDPDTAAYLQTLLDKRRREERDDDA